MVRPSAMAPEETTRISAPPAASAAMSSASEASQSRFRPVARSTSSAEPILTVMRRYFFSDWIVIAAPISASALRRTSLPATPRAPCATSAISARSTASTPSPVTADSSSGARPAARFSDAAFFLRGVGVERIDLAQRHDLRLLGQAVAIGRELARAPSCRPCPDALLLRRDQMQQHARALDMAEEAVADADALMRAFDQARECRRCTNSRPSMRATPSPGCSVVKG